MGGGEGQGRFRLSFTHFAGLGVTGVIGHGLIGIEELPEQDTVVVPTQEGLVTGVMGMHLSSIAYSRIVAIKDAWIVGRSGQPYIDKAYYTWKLT